MKTGSTKYRVVASPYRKVEARVQFSATNSEIQPSRFTLDLPTSETDGIVVALLAGNVETGIRINQALKRGEEVDLGHFDREDLLVIGFQEDGTANAS